MPPKRTTSAIVPGITKRRAIQVGATTRVAVPVKHEDPTTEDAVSQLREEFVNLLQQHKNEITNSKLKDTFGPRYSQLPTIINGFSKEGRLTMMKDGDELVYRLASAEEASKFSGLDVAARMVYQIIEKAGNKGIWTKDIRVQSNIQQQALNKIFKQLENRQLIKPLKSVAAKAKKLYILYDLTPAKEVTGGPWYTELEFDHEFVAELRTFILHCVRRLNSGKGVTLREIASKMKEANVSRVELSLNEVQQLMQTLAFDYMIEQGGVNLNGEALFVAAKRVSCCCDFKYYEVLCPDFKFRDIVFEDGVILSAHEPHHHSAS